jgi:hypothetical protein
VSAPSSSASASARDKRFYQRELAALLLGYVGVDNVA